MDGEGGADLTDKIVFIEAFLHLRSGLFLLFFPVHDGDRPAGFCQTCGFSEKPWNVRSLVSDKGNQYEIGDGVGKGNAVFPERTGCTC